MEIQTPCLRIAGLREERHQTQDGEIRKWPGKCLEEDCSSAWDSLLAISLRQSSLYKAEALAISNEVLLEDNLLTANQAVSSWALPGPLHQQNKRIPPDSNSSPPLPGSHSWQDLQCAGHCYTYFASQPSWENREKPILCSSPGILW